MIYGKNIIHKYDLDKAVDNICIDISKGEFISIVGESGSGKSTLLSVLSTLLKPTSGEVSIFDKNIADIKDLDKFRRENIGFVFQFHYLINYLTIKENIQLASDIKNDPYIDELLDYLNIKALKDKYPNEVSGGQRQRAAIARALANKPKILFADEPTGNLDSKNSKNVFELFKSISNQGTTIVVATHDQELARSTNKTYEMRDGKVSNIY